jgi:heparan-sulfate lyase
MNKPYLKYTLVLILLMFCFLQQGIAQVNPTSTKKILSRLNLETEKLKSVKENQDNQEFAASELLNYYKTRTFVKHLVKRNSTPDDIKKNITEKELKYANDALEHIFVGQPAYPSYFAGDDINWGLRPVPDNEWVWQLNRMYFWNAMGKVYAQTGDEKFAKAWGEQLIDWTIKNPRDDEHKYAWRSIETGIRGHSWTSLFQRFIDSPNFTPGVLVAFLNSLHDHAEFLMTVYRTKSNWGLMEAEGLAFIAITFPEFKNAETWRSEAFRRLNNEINIQVYPDGHQRELAMGYHLGCIHWFLRTYELANLNNLDTAFPESYLDKVEKMCEVPMKLCLPDGTNVQFGDAWRGSPGQHKDKFLEWAEFFDRDDFLYLTTDGKEGTPPKQTAFALKESGLYSMRSGWNKDAVCLVLKCGPDGGGHCQPDNGTFVVYAGGRNFTPDAGSYIYSGDPEGRKWFRQTKVHQTLTLNGENSDYAPKQLLSKPGDDTDILVVENQSYENLTHRRSVFFVEKSYFIVVDDAIGSATGNVDIHFQLAPGGDAIFNRVSNSVRSDFKDGWNIFIRTNPQKGLKLEKEEGWVSFKYTKKQPRPAFRYRMEKNNANQPVRFITLVAPYEKEVPEIQITNFMEESGKMKIEVLENGERKIFGY